MTPTNLSKPQKILLVANVLTTIGRTPFDVSELTVESWQRYPDTFGLRGFKAQYPDKNIIVSCLSGKAKGMVAGKGWLRRTKENTYEMTKLGCECVEKIGQGKLKSNTQVHRTLESRFLDRLVKCQAYKQELRGTRQPIGFDEAREFFGGAKHINDVQRKLAEIGESESPRAGEARSLMHLAEWLVWRFRIQFSLVGANGKGKS